MRLEDAGEGVMVPSQTGDDALRAVPVDEYETVFSFPTVGQNSEMCLTRCHGFWLTFYVDAARCDSGQGPRANQTKYARSMRAFKVRASKRDPPKFFVSTPPAGLFSHRDIVWQCDVQWPYEKSASNWLHAVIPAERLLDFRRGVQCDAATEFRVYSRYKKGRGTSSVGSLYTNITIWHCFCGPEDHSVDAKEKFAKLCSGKAKRISRKVGCQCRFQSCGFSEKFTFMPYEGGAPLDSKFVRIRWPLKNGVPVWHAKHEVVPSWPASKHEDIKNLGKNTSSSGVNSVATVMRISQELQDVEANMSNVEKIRDPNAQRKVLLHYQAANKLMEEILLKEKEEDARGENTHVTPPRTSQIGVGVHMFASPTGNLPRIEHEKRSELNDDTLQRGKGALERAKRRRQSGGGGAAKLHK